MSKAKLYYQQARQYLGEMMDGQHEKEVAMIRQRMQPRWAEAQNCKIEEIDYSDPFVSVEWKLCDMGVEKTLRTGTDEERARILSTWTTEELDVYYNGDHGLTGPSYREQVEDGSFVKMIGKAMLGKVKKRKAV